MTVAVKRYDGTSVAIKEAIELCGGFNNIKAGDYILLKPNIFWGGGLFHKSIPKYGLVTSSRIIEDTIIALKDYGCSRIAVGEGTVLDKSLMSTTKSGFKWIGLPRLKKKYGIKLIDFYDTAFRKVSIGGQDVHISESVFECDMLLNMPILKTHIHAVVSLGMKNLKGCLSMASKKSFHHGNLHELIAHLAEYMKPGLTIIDGIYFSEKGPGPMTIAHRGNAIIAGRDVFTVDIVGSEIMGIRAGDVPSIQYYSRHTGRPAEIQSVDIKGDPVESFNEDIQWDIDFNDYLKNEGLSGIQVKPHPYFVCSGCVTGIQCGLAIFAKDNKNRKLENIIIGGEKDINNNDNSGTVILPGNCVIKRNKDLTEAIKMPKCPVTTVDIYLSLVKQLSRTAALRVLIKRLIKIICALTGIYKESMMMKKYDSPEFDASHFR